LSDAFWNALPATIMATAALVASLRNGRIAKATASKVEVLGSGVVGLSSNVTDLKEKINGQTHALIAAKEDVARAVGEITGKAIGKEQAKADAADLVEAVANKMTADQVLRDEGRAQGTIRTRHDDPPKDAT
jgi:outer membrane murein-binding lipoprotein Lpp